MTTKLNLKKFEKNLVVRPLRPADWEGVVALERLAFPAWSRGRRSSSKASSHTFPEGQIGVEYQGKLVASSGSLILDFELYKDWHDFDEISDNGYIRNHKPDGTTLYGIEIMVDPDLSRPEAGPPALRRPQAAGPRKEPDAHRRRRPHPRLRQARRRT